ncbi:MAG: 3-keto-5-aminohexanoate cleavage protein [Deltaproteobacteria bacterium]|nr:MAG: 3-keto-5-aminohexanoate cleavage protein [Deltaproteobacteria bacterium]
MSSQPCILTAALNGVLTDPKRYPVPVTPEQMAAEARRAQDAGATVVHVHFRRQEPGLGHLPTWDPKTCAQIVTAIREQAPGVLINCSTGVIGPDISGPAETLRAIKPEIAAMNAGTLNYLKTRRDGRWAWPPMVFDNPVDKIERFLKVMAEVGAVPEFECFDTGIVRSVELFRQAGLARAPFHLSFVMGVASGMPARTDLLPILLSEAPQSAHCQSIVIGRTEVWDVHRRMAELGGDVRTGLEDTFYLPSGDKADSNGPLVEALAALVREVGREPATLEQTRAAYGLDLE